MPSPLNTQVRTWGKTALADLKAEFTKLNIIHRPNSPSPRASVEVLANYFKERQGEVDRITFKFPRHMVFVHKGVGKDRPASNPGKPKEWFNPVIDKEIETLADIVAEGQGDLIVNRLRIG